MRLASTSTRRAAIAAAAALSLIAGAALAAVPSPPNSTIPSCIKASPDGSLTTTFLVRDVAANPVYGAVVSLVYADCADFELCSPTGRPPENYFVDPPNQRIYKHTDPSGQATFNIRAGGGCHVYPIRIYADGVFFGARPAASTDQNGDLVVDPVDVAILQSKVGTGDLTGDLDCDGVVDNDDVAIQAASLGSSCLDPTPARPHTWGRVKVLYR